MLHWIRGLAHHELGDTASAGEAFDQALSIARLVGSTAAEARALANLAVTRLQQGDAEGAEQSIEGAKSLDAGSARGTVVYLSALYEQRLGNHRQALDLYEQALPLLVDSGDMASVAGLHLNPGVLFTYLNDLVKATSDYSVAESVAQRQGLVILEAMAVHNLGFALGRLGALADALQTFDRAGEIYRRLDYAPRQLPVLHTDHAEALLAAGLGVAAGRAARAAVEALENAGNSIDLAEAQLLLARISVVIDEPETAQQMARRAAQGFRSLGRRSWAAMAEYVDLLADIAATTEFEYVPPAPTVRRFSTMASRLLQSGWVVESMDARFWAARLAAVQGNVTLAEQELLAARRLRGRLSPAQIINRWHAHASIGLASGDLNKASSAVSSGLRAAESYRSQIGATDARIEAARLAGSLARTGVEIAFRRQSPAAVFRAAEQGRATVMQLAPVVPAHGSPVDVELNRLRTELTRSPEDGDHLRSLPSVPADAEQAVSNLALRAWTDPVSLRPTSLVAVQRHLAGRVLVEYVEHRSRLHAVVATSRKASLVDLGPIEPIRRAQSFLYASLQQILRRGPRHAHRASFGITRSAGELSRLLIGGLGLSDSGMGDADLILVPAGSLHRLTWSLLPDLAKREFCIAPSASLWLRQSAATHEASTGEASTGQISHAGQRVLIVCGPGLPGARSETERLTDLYPQATVLVGPLATRERVLTELENADLVHIAAHGHFRSDNPMFSSIVVADGPITIYDLERLKHVPTTMILTACEAGTPVVSSTEELLGTTSVLLSLGVTTVVAPVVPVPDGTLDQFVLDLHQGLISGMSPRVAYQTARCSAAERQDILAAVTAQCFLPIGSQ